MRSCKIPSGAAMPVFGIGTWRMGESARRRGQELDALKYGLELGYPMIDTAEMYGEGGAEEIVGEAIAGRGTRPFIVSKVYPHNATRSRHHRRLRAQPEAPAASSGIDLYLLHWRGGARLEETFEAFHRLREAGKIADFGVSNFDRGDMEEAARLDKGLTGTNQVLYCLSRRGPEFDLLPWMRQRSIPLMAYSPLDQGGLLAQARRSRSSPTRSAARRRSWRSPGCWPSPASSRSPSRRRRERVKENFGAIDVKLSPKVLAELDRAFPPPKGKQPLEML